MWVILIVIAIISIALKTVFYLNRRLLIRDMNLLLNQGYMFFKHSYIFSENNAFVLSNECNELKKVLQLMEKTLGDLPKSKELQELLVQYKEQYLQLEEMIKEKKEAWGTYLQFKDNLPYVTLNMENSSDEINARAIKLISENEGLEEIIREKTEKVVEEMQTVIAEYRALDRSNFNEFNFLILEDLQQSYEKVAENARKHLMEIALFYKEIRISLKSLKRKSSFYLTLEESVEGKRGKKRVNDLLVSFKTYNDAVLGKPYEKDNVIARKRAVNFQTTELMVLVDDFSYKLEQELTNDQIGELFNELKLPFKGEKDEHGVPLELQTDSLDVLVCAKEEKSFEIKHHTVFFQNLEIYEIIDSLQKKSSKV